MLLLKRKQVSALEFNHHESPFFFFAAHHSVTSFNLQISDDISDQTKEIQKLKCEIRSCDTKLDHASAWTSSTRDLDTSSAGTW